MGGGAAGTKKGGGGESRLSRLHREGIIGKRPHPQILTAICHPQLQITAGNPVTDRVA